jgi:hypothetical protein
MLNKIYKTLPFLTLLLLPMLTFAQPSDRLGGTYRIFAAIGNIVRDILVPLVFTLALLAFFYGVVKYIWSEGQGKDDGKRIMIWGVVGIFVMATVWGLVAFLAEELGIDDAKSSMTVPTIETTTP